MLSIRWKEDSQETRSFAWVRVRSTTWFLVTISKRNLFLYVVALQVPKAVYYIFCRLRLCTTLSFPLIKIITRQYWGDSRIIFDFRYSIFVPFFWYIWCFWAAILESRWCLKIITPLVTYFIHVYEMNTYIV